MEKINEGSLTKVSLTFNGFDGTLVTPVSVRYRVGDKATGNIIRDWTALTAAETVEISLQDGDVAIVNDTLKYEKHILTVEASYGDGKITHEKEFELKNLQFYPGS